MMRSELESLILQIRQLVDSHIGSPDSPGVCAYYATIAKITLGARIVGGSASWQFTSFDNGRNPTHFSYIYEPERASSINVFALNEVSELIELNALPEMHVWNIYQGKVLDLSTKNLPRHFALTHGKNWESLLLPPDYHFGKPVHKKGRFVYRAHPQATRIANDAFLQIRKKMGV